MHRVKWDHADGLVWSQFVAAARTTINSNVEGSDSSDGGGGSGVVFQFAASAGVVVYSFGFDP